MNNTRSTNLNGKARWALELLEGLLEQYGEKLPQTNRVSLETDLLAWSANGFSFTNEVLGEIYAYLAAFTPLRIENAKNVLKDLMVKFRDRIGHDAWMTHEVRQKAQQWAKGPNAFKSVSVFFAEAEKLADIMENELARTFCERCEAETFNGFKLCGACHRSRLVETFNRRMASLQKQVAYLQHELGALPSWQRSPVHAGAVKDYVECQKLQSVEGVQMPPATILQMAIVKTFAVRDSLQIVIADEKAARRQRQQKVRPPQEPPNGGHSHWEDGSQFDVEEANEASTGVKYMKSTPSGKNGPGKAGRIARKQAKKAKLQEPRPWEKRERQFA